MKIEYYKTEHYGSTYRYVANSRQAAALRRLTRNKTISLVDIEALRILGFEVQEVLQPETEAKEVKKCGKY